MIDSRCPRFNKQTGIETIHSLVECQQRIQNSGKNSCKLHAMASGFCAPELKREGLVEGSALSCLAIGNLPVSRCQTRALIPIRRRAADEEASWTGVENLMEASRNRKRRVSLRPQGTGAPLSVWIRERLRSAANGLKQATGRRPCPVGPQCQAEKGRVLELEFFAPKRSECPFGPSNDRMEPNGLRLR